jgi:hypothetical protein
LQLGWRVGSSKISTSTRTLVNSVYHGRYFDSIYPCEVRGHSPETGKARNTKGGLCLLASFLAALLQYPETRKLNVVIIFVLFASCSHSHTFSSVGIMVYDNSSLPNVGFVFVKKMRSSDINFYSSLKCHPQSGRLVRDQRAREEN